MRTPTAEVNTPSPKFNAKLIMALALTICISCGGFVTVQHPDSESPIKVIAQPSFTDSDGKLNVIGIVKNSGNMPVEVNLGLNIVARDSGLVTTIKEPTYGRVIYPSSVSPFKFAVEPSWSLSRILTPYHKVLSLSYSNMPVGNEKALIGTAKNVSPVDLHNVTILASVHRTREPRSIPLRVSYFMSFLFL